MPDPFAIARPFASMLTQRLRRLRARDGNDTRVCDLPPAAAVPDTPVDFRCNLCGSHNLASLRQLHRETPSCPGCGSNVRFRAMARLVVLEMLGREAILADVPKRPDIAGLGLSDVGAYAVRLAKRFSYENTWFHTAPRLDIANVSAKRFGRYDFVIASDLFEHVAPPVSRAFVNVRRLLKPGGKFIFTVPFSLEPETVEHFPDLHEWAMSEREGAWSLTNTTRAGVRQTFDNLIFHGGPGTTLEMRVFSRAGLEREFARAGFAHMRVAAEPYLPFGIHWPEPFSVPMVAYAP